MNVALFVGSFPTLTETWIIDEVAALLGRGDRVTIYADASDTREGVHPAVREHHMLDLVRARPTRHGGTARRLASAAALAVVNLPRHPIAMLGAVNPLKYGWRACSGDMVRAAAGSMDGARFDVVHAHSGDSAYLAAACKRWGLLRDPLLTTFHGPDLTFASWVKKNNGYDALIEQGDLFTVGSAFIKGVAVRNGLPEEKLRVLPMGIESAKFEFRERTMASERDVRVLSVARLAPVKGLEYGIRAFAKALKSVPRMRYAIAGDGPLRDDLPRLAAELGVADRMEFLGMLPHDRLAPVWNEADVFLMPGVTDADGQVEGQGVVLLEAQASGLPVIASRAGGMPENVIEGASALLVEPKDVDGLAEAMVALATHPQRWAAMGRAGREFVRREREQSIMHHRLFGMLADVARTGRRS